MKNDNLRKGFTLAEIMVALVVIGIITSIILPVAYNNLPSEKVMKFKKGNATLAKVINELVMSGEYYMAGDLGTDNNGSGVSATYFCETFSDLVTTKRINCLNTDNGDYKIGMYRLEGMGSETLSDKKTSALKYVDSMCKQYHPKDKNNKETFEIITSDNVKFYTINPATTFSTKAPNASYDMFSPCLQTYKIMCMQVDDEIFGYGIRKDGRIMAGERALAWMEKSIQSKEDENNIEIQNIGLVNVAFSAADSTNALSCKSQPYQNTVPDINSGNNSNTSGGTNGGNSSGGNTSGGSSSSGSGSSSSGSTSGGSSSGGSGSSSSGSSSGGTSSGSSSGNSGTTYTPSEGLYGKQVTTTIPTSNFLASKQSIGSTNCSNGMSTGNNDKNCNEFKLASPVECESGSDCFRRYKATCSAACGEANLSLNSWNTSGTCTCASSYYSGNLVGVGYLTTPGKQVKDSSGVTTCQAINNPCQSFCASKGFSGGKIMNDNYGYGVSGSDDCSVQFYNCSCK